MAPPLNLAVAYQILEDLRKGQMRSCLEMGFAEHDLKSLVEPNCMSMLVNAPVPWVRVIVDSLMVQRLLAQAKKDEEDQLIMHALKMGASSPMIHELFGLPAKEVALRRTILGIPNRSGRWPVMSQQPPSAPSEQAGILFTGNPHETVPRRLLLDNRLTPLERNAWQVFRLLLNDDGLTSFPTYEQLRPYLAASPFKLASRETVAKVLTTLRLTRWLSLAGRVRDEVTGQVKGNIYLLHDEPVSISEALLLDSGYLELLGNAMEHANKSIREVAAFTLEEFQRDPDVRDLQVPSQLDILQQRLGRQTWVSKPSSESELM